MSKIEKIEFFLQLSPQGEFYNGENKVSQPEGLKLTQNLRRQDNNTYITSLNNIDYLVESYDFPRVALSVKPSSENEKKWLAHGAYGFQWEFSLNEIYCDLWDRFIAKTPDSIPFVLSDKAQDQFFSTLDSFDDNSITYKEKIFPIDSWQTGDEEINLSDNWTSIYQSQTPGWELEAPTPLLSDNLHRLKLSKSKIVVLGCGSGNDAAYLAQQGHIVTAIDFSAEALSQAQKKYGHLENLRFIQADAFNLPQELYDQFDLVIEHTCFCAIVPEKRYELVKVWKRLLREGGQLLGIFFVTPYRQGPPFGSTEWEIENFLKKDFQFLLWERAKNSPGQRHGKELFVLALKRPE